MFMGAFDVGLASLPFERAGKGCDQSLPTLLKCPPPKSDAPSVTKSGWKDEAAPSDCVFELESCVRGGVELESRAHKEQGIHETQVPPFPTNQGQASHAHVSVLLQR